MTPHSLFPRTKKKKQICDYITSIISVVTNEDHHSVVELFSNRASNWYHYWLGPKPLFSACHPPYLGQVKILDNDFTRHSLTLDYLTVIRRNFELCSAFAVFFSLLDRRWEHIQIFLCILDRSSSCKRLKNWREKVSYLLWSLAHAFAMCYANWDWFSGADGIPAISRLPCFLTTFID